MKKAAILMALVLSVPCIVHADALPATISTVNDGYGASVSFAVVGSTLQVTLTNTGTGDVFAPTDVLTGVFFDLNGGALTPESATTDGSIITGTTVLDVTGYNVGGEWAYASGLSGAPNGALQGISSTGLGLFGSGNFNGTDLQFPDSVDGLNYGITSAGDVYSTGNAKIMKTPLISNEVVFILSFTGAAPTEVSNIYFQYGTSLGETQVPEPGYMLLLGMGLFSASLIGWRFKKF